jgi:hypothetical protein
MEPERGVAETGKSRLNATGSTTNLINQAVNLAYMAPFAQEKTCYAAHLSNKHLLQILMYILHMPAPPIRDGIHLLSCINAQSASRVLIPPLLASLQMMVMIAIRQQGLEMPSMTLMKRPERAPEQGRETEPALRRYQPECQPECQHQSRTVTARGVAAQTVLSLPLLPRPLARSKQRPRLRDLVLMNGRNCYCFKRLFYNMASLGAGLSHQM